MLFSEPFGGVIAGARGAVLAGLLRTNAPLTGRRIHALVSDDYSDRPRRQSMVDAARVATSAHRGV